MIKWKMFDESTFARDGLTMFVDGEISLTQLHDDFMPGMLEFAKEVRKMKQLRISVARRYARAALKRMV